MERKKEGKKERRKEGKTKERKKEEMEIFLSMKKNKFRL